MKTIYCVNVENGMTTFFFSEKGKLLHWTLEESFYRPEYMGPLLKALGINVVMGEPKDDRFVGEISRILLEMGYLEEDLARLLTN